ncbi:hypothetical protein ACVWZK_000008 [Bradyrhizobium sp. GM0.4]|uniref:hypothetical protein n=1 Tax=Bradyrhizobium sp. CW11 TaxID=2782684 RepID=UPI001FFB0097|nr:hypothetical protein [Bradyrhizobium sp. CW11]MCK1346395.1 hypothetical protein [Bradyrhizobium sp. CW11]
MSLFVRTSEERKKAARALHPARRITAPDFDRKRFFDNREQIKEPNAVVEPKQDQLLVSPMKNQSVVGDHCSARSASFLRADVAKLS